MEGEENVEMSDLLMSEHLSEKGKLTFVEAANEAASILREYLYEVSDGQDLLKLYPSTSDVEESDMDLRLNRIADVIAGLEGEG